MALRTEHLNLISICTGGFGLDLGVELAIPSARTVCMVEREAFAVAQLVSAMEAGHMAAAPIWSDARTFNGRAWRGAVDGLIGGIPCQPHSTAGKQLGEEDERDLWSNARRIIVQSGAWFALIENVRGIISTGGAERVWRDFQRLGFEVEGGLFTATEVGASHGRERFFLLAVANPAGFGKWRGQRNVRGQDGRSRSELLQQHISSSDEMAYAGCGRQRWGEKSNIGKIEPEQPTPRWGDTKRCYRAVADTSSGRHDRRSDVEKWGEVPRTTFEGASLSLFPPRPSDTAAWAECLRAAPHLEPSVRRVADGVAPQMDQLRMLGNGVVPLQAAYALRTLITRLAARGSAGAACLVRMMEGTEG
ncbi:DNA cytosine methyltransferase [Agrobacterium sp. S2/73]|uniref:DNA cytosine methyltransferase n=1 Tax=Agrobacterium sp. S7/73 TaxID=2820002 RepID=UPI001ADB1AAE|nr:DNA cytosine methyltransferase [Agrobacterium sp. S2/73]QXZ73483.1 DNA cytosine methyltransferase [Agrobacterium sp. S7/73]